MRNSRAKETQHNQAHPKAGATYSPRKLYRGLTVPYSSEPGKKRIHPKKERKTEKKFVNVYTGQIKADDWTTKCKECGQEIIVPFNNPAGPEKCPNCVTTDWYKGTGEEK